MFVALAAAMVLVAAAAAFAVFWCRAVAVAAAATARCPDPPAPGIPDGIWRARHADAVLLPVLLLEQTASPDELRTAASHRDRVDMICDWYRTEGPARPLRVNVDGLGRVCVADGHHRIVAARRLGMDWLPVQFEIVARIPGFGQPMARFLVAALSPDAKRPPRP